MLTFRQWLTETPFSRIFNKGAVGPAEPSTNPPAKKTRARRRKKNAEPSPEARAAQAAYYERGNKAFRGKVLEPDWGGIRPELHDKLMNISKDFPKKDKPVSKPPPAPSYKPPEQKKKKWWKIFEENRGK